MKKLILGILLIFLVIGIASAADTNQIFKAPSTLHPVGTDAFVDGNGHNLQVFEDTDDAHGIWFENSTKYSVGPANSTCYVGADDENDCYILEIVEHDGKRYIVSSWTPNGVGDTAIINSNLEEFNKINDLSPIPI